MGFWRKRGQEGRGEDVVNVNMWTLIKFERSKHDLKSYTELTNFNPRLRV